MEDLFHHSKNVTEFFDGNLITKKFRNSITFHPAKETQLMYRMHLYNLKLMIQELYEEYDKIQEDLWQSL